MRILRRRNSFWSSAGDSDEKRKGYDIRKASVFCTPSIALEYMHLDEIKAFGTDLIEMETSSFYLMTDLFELPGIALLVVSDNSASGAAWWAERQNSRDNMITEGLSYSRI